MPDVYSKRYTPEVELLQNWTEQGDKIVALGNLIARLKELGARAGEVWTAEPALQQGRATWIDGNSTIPTNIKSPGRPTEMITVLLLSANPLDDPLSIE